MVLNLCRVKVYLNVYCIMINVSSLRQHTEIVPRDGLALAATYFQPRDYYLRIIGDFFLNNGVDSEE